MPAVYVVFVCVRQGDQFTSGFVKVNPNSKIPALVDNGAPGGKVRRRRRRWWSLLPCASKVSGHLGHVMPAVSCFCCVFGLGQICRGVVDSSRLPKLPSLLCRAVSLACDAGYFWRALLCWKGRRDRSLAWLRTLLSTLSLSLCLRGSKGIKTSLLCLRPPCAYHSAAAVDFPMIRMELFFDLLNYLRFFFFASRCFCCSSRAAFPPCPPPARPLCSGGDKNAHRTITSSSTSLYTCSRPATSSCTWPRRAESSSPRTRRLRRSASTGCSST